MVNDVLTVWLSVVVLNNRDEVVTTNVSDKGVRLSDLGCCIGEDLCGEPDDGVAAKKTIVIVVRLEIVKIGVDESKVLLPVDPAFQFRGDLKVSG